MTERIKLEDIKNPTDVKDGVVQSILLEYKITHNRFDSPTKERLATLQIRPLEHSLEFIQQLKQQILQDHEIVNRLNELIKEYDILSDSDIKGWMIRDELQKIKGETK